jgi:type II secretory pathway pseudopilin PulG
MVDALLGPLGGILAAVVSVVAALILGRWQGATRARADRAAKDARDYRDERQRIDRTDIGIGATDADRIDRLRAIANRRGSGPS